MFSNELSTIIYGHHVRFGVLGQSVFKCICRGQGTFVEDDLCMNNVTSTIINEPNDILRDILLVSTIVEVSVP